MFASTTMVKRPIRSGALLIGVTLLAAGLLPAPARSQSPVLLDPSTLTKFVDPLPLPATARPTGIVRGVPQYTMTARQFSQMLHRDLPGPTDVWGYDDNSSQPGSAGYPGPTIEARKGRPIDVTWVNGLPQTPLLPVDPSIPGATDHGPTSIATHLHGGEIPAESDGGPDHWFEPGESRTLRYPNVQRSAPLWYHDHAVGITRLNVYAGLAGFYNLRDASEPRLRLPFGAYEIPLAIQDRSFTADGRLAYSSTPPCPFFGNTALVNGKVWPYLNVEPRRYRFRILNGSNARLYELSLFESDQAGTYTSGATPGPAFRQTGSDGGFLPSAVTIPSKLSTAPGERADVVVDFSGLAGKFFLLRNEAQGGGIMGMGGGIDRKSVV